MTTHLHTKPFYKLERYNCNTILVLNIFKGFRNMNAKKCIKYLFCNRIERYKLKKVFERKRSCFHYSANWSVYGLNEPLKRIESIGNNISPMYLLFCTFVCILCEQRTLNDAKRNVIISI